MKQKYYLIDYPESKRFKRLKGSIQSEGMSYFVPCELYDKMNENENSGTT